MSVNRKCILIAGKSASGKSASLRNIKNPKGVLYLNCEAGKELPFVSNFVVQTVTHPLEVEKWLQQIEGTPDCHTVIIDTLTYLMDMFESKCILTSANTMKAWGDYAQFFKRLMQQHVAVSTKNIIFLAHTRDILNESEMVMETLVKVKGSLMDQGIESYFNNVIATKKIAISKLQSYQNPMLVITPQEEALGFKYVYQTQLTKETVNDKIRGPIGMWSTAETYIDNDIQLVIDKLHTFYS